jgi:hypothetical protein
MLVRIASIAPASGRLLAIAGHQRSRMDRVRRLLAPCRRCDGRETVAEEPDAAIPRRLAYAHSRQQYVPTPSLGPASGPRPAVVRGRSRGRALPRLGLVAAAVKAPVCEALPGRFECLAPARGARRRLPRRGLGGGLVSLTSVSLPGGRWRRFDWAMEISQWARRHLLRACPQRHPLAIGRVARQPER